MFKLTLILSTLLLTSALYASEVVISRTDNDDNKEIYDLVVKVNDTTQRLEELYKDTYLDGKKIRRDKLNPEDMKTKEGCILEKRDNYNVLNLKSDNLDYDRGARIIIDTLYNGITGDRRQVDVELAKDKTGWRLFKDKKIVSKFHVKVNKIVVLGTVGIKTVIIE